MKQPQPGTREIGRINWIELCEWVPAKINAVLVPSGKLEPCTVAPNGRRSSRVWQ